MDEVTYEEFRLLVDYSLRTNEFTVIERHEKEVIKKSVQEQIKYVENKTKEEEIKKKKQEEKRLLRKMKLDEKDREARRIAYEKLKSEFEQT